MQAQTEAFDREWKHGSREKAKALARAYVEAHQASLNAILGQYNLEELVGLVDGYRQAGREEDRIVADMWLLTKYEPQTIVGSLTIGVAQAVEEAMRIVAQGEHHGQ